MKPASFDYVAPATIDQALAVLARDPGEARPLAGGQSLVPMLNFRIARPGCLVDLNRIPALAYIERSGDRAGDVVRIGAMTRQEAVRRDPTIRAAVPLLAAALDHVGHPQTRARGTIGGSIAHADPAAELPVALVALDASLVLRQVAGERVVPARGFFLGTFLTAAQPAELLVEIRVPVDARAGAGFAEVSRRPGDFAIVAAAASLRLAADGRCAAAALALAGLADYPVLVMGVAEALVGRPFEPASLTAALGGLDAIAVTQGSHHGSAAYRRRIAPAVAKRALLAAAAGARAFLP
jgi:carbon-monoxide dehydrogenase medium subunit